MKVINWFEAVAVALLVAAAPAIAQNDQRSGSQSGKPQSQQGARAKGPQAHQTPPSGQQPKTQRPQPAPPPQGQPRSAQPHQKPQPQGQPRSAQPHQKPQPQGQPRSAQPHQKPQPQGQPRSAQPHGTPPPTHRPPGGQRPGAGAAPGHHAPTAPSRQRVYPVPGIHDQPSPRIFVPHRHYPRPFFASRPQYWLGFGLYAGYRLPYPLMFGYPTYVYDQGEVVVLPPLPTSAMYGGISFDIVPDDAIVRVDGVDVGMACDFSPAEQPLTLRPGRHHIELQAPGMLPLAFDVEIIAGEVLPFSGVLRPR